MEVQTLGELLKSQQNQILSLSIHMDCLIEELEDKFLIVFYQLIKNWLIKFYLTSLSKRFKLSKLIQNGKY